MKAKTYLSIAAAGLFALSLLASEALAIDQVTLKSGEIIEGKVLADVPHQHVDIQLVNGTKRRIKRDDVNTVERDVPSNLDLNMMGSESRGYFGAMIGEGYNFDSVSKSVRFNAGIRAGVNAAQLKSSKLAFGLGFNYGTQSPDATHSLKVSEILAQMLFRKIANSGLYAGAEFGLAFNSVTHSTNSALNEMISTFEVGALVGYDFFLTDGFSIGPELRLDRNFQSDGQFGYPILAASTLRFMIGGTLHL